MSSEFSRARELQCVCVCVCVREEGLDDGSIALSLLVYSCLTHSMTLLSYILPIQNGYFLQL